ncbi:hypothetical protein J6590_055686 [Homalodisca vitripennis]|nr:hypothetical protein J6590_055686 [Homalodisca vitripennis]
MREPHAKVSSPLVEYASPVWSLFTNCAKDRLEALQRRFARLVGVKLNPPSLALYHDVADDLLLLKIDNGHLRCSEQLAQFDFRVPAFTISRAQASFHHFWLQQFKFRMRNHVASECDLFCDNVPLVRTRAFDIQSA